jgi:hypothetical protein
MPRFTDHAYKRFVTRRLGLSRLTGRSSPDQLNARESFRRGQLISRDEATMRLHGPIKPGAGDFYYRADGTGPGVWVVCYHRGQEIVITYLIPRPIFRPDRKRLVPPVKMRHPVRLKHRSTLERSLLSVL